MFQFQLSNNQNLEISNLVNLESKNNYNEFRENHQSLIQNQLKNEIRILIIDDEKDIAELFKTILYNLTKDEKNKKKIYIDSFDKSKDALMHFINVNEQNKNNLFYYDLIILDIRMPGINGIQLYQILKIINPKINVIFISALNVIPELVDMLPGVNLKDIIKKPVDIEYFLTKVEEKIDLWI